MKKQLLILALMLIAALSAISQTTTLYTQGNITITNTSGITVTVGSLYDAPTGGNAVTNITSGNLGTTAIVIGSGHIVTAGTAISIGYLTFNGGTLVTASSGTNTNVTVTNTLSGTGNVSQSVASNRLAVNANISNAVLTSTGGSAANIAITGATINISGTNTLPPLQAAASASPSTISITLAALSTTTTSLTGFGTSKTVTGNTTAKLSLNAASTIFVPSGGTQLSRLSAIQTTGNVTVSNGTLTINDSLVIGGNSSAAVGFIISSGAGVTMASASRIIRTSTSTPTATGTFTIPTDVNVEYANTTDLTTGAELPATVSSFTIRGTADVTLNANLTVGTYNGTPSSGTDTLKIAASRKLIILGIGSIVANSKIMAANTGSSLEIANTSGTVLLPTTAIASLSTTQHSNIILNNAGGVLSLLGRNPVSNHCTVNLGNVTFNAGSSLLLDAEAPSTSTRILPIVNGTLIGSGIFNIAPSNVSAASRLSLGTNSIISDFSYTTTSSAQVAQFGSAITMSGTVTLPTSFVFNSSNTGTSTTANITLSSASNITFAGLSMNGSQNTSKKFLGSPTANLTITGTTRTGGANAGGALVFDQTGSNNQLGNLTIGSGAKTDSINIGSNLTVINALSLTRGTLYVTNGNTLSLDATTGSATLDSAAVLSIPATATVDFASRPVTLKSSTSGTASIATISGTLSGATNVTVERYIPSSGRRRYVLVGSPASGASIYNAWQEGGASNAGYGTLITGGAAGGTLGFDLPTTSGKSIFTYNDNNSSGSKWVGLANTNATNLSAGAGYLLFVRGDRTLNLATTPTASGNTTLRATGTIGQGIISPTLLSGANKYTLIANPYPCAIDWNSDSITKTNLTGNFTVYDANNNVFVSSNGTVKTPNVGNQQAGYIQSGQAFFVQNDGTGNGAITFTEAAKTTSATTSSSTTVFGEAANNVQLNINVYRTADNSFVDGAVALFGSKYKAAVDANEDIYKFTNLNETFGLRRNNVVLGLEARPAVSSKDSLYFSLSNFAKKAYSLVIDGSNLASTTAKLEDKYTSTTTEIDVTGTTTYNFTVTDDAASYSNDRFVITFGSTAASSAVIDGTAASSLYVKMSPNPVSNQLQVSFKTATVEATSINVVNSLGQVVKTVNAGNVANGNVIVPVSELANGVYSVQLLSGNKVIHTQRVVKTAN